MEEGLVEQLKRRTRMTELDRIEERFLNSNPLRATEFKMGISGMTGGSIDLLAFRDNMGLGFFNMPKKKNELLE